MGSKSLRISLPLWTLILETAFIVVFFFFTSYETPLKKLELLKKYPGFQDINVMAVLGLAFLKASLRRYTWSSVAFNLFTLALGVQLAIILDGFLFSFSSGKIIINIHRIILGTMTTMSVLISSGAVLGKVNLIQLIVMTLLEVTAFQGTKKLIQDVLNMDEHESMMQIHVFGAYFGVTVAWCLPQPRLHATKDKERRTPTSCLFTTLGKKKAFILGLEVPGEILPINSSLLVPEILPSVGPSHSFQLALAHVGISSRVQIPQKGRTIKSLATINALLRSEDHEF